MIERYILLIFFKEIVMSVVKTMLIVFGVLFLIFGIIFMSAVFSVAVLVDMDAQENGSRNLYELNYTISDGSGTLTVEQKDGLIRILNDEKEVIRIGVENLQLQLDMVETLLLIDGFSATEILAVSQILESEIH